MDPELRGWLKKWLGISFIICVNDWGDHAEPCRADRPCSCSRRLQAGCFNENLTSSRQLL